MRHHFRAAAGWRYLLLGGPPILLAAAIGAAWILLSPPAAAAHPGLNAAVAGDAEAAAPAAPPLAGLLVDVSGAVVHPGMYRLQRGERVYSAIAAAGGTTADADQARLPNLAAVLKDGMQIRVPSVRAAASGTARATALDLNSASAEELETVPGFSTDLAQAVIAYRTQFGGFESTRELVTVLGMGTAEYTQARRYVRV